MKSLGNVTNKEIKIGKWNYHKGFGRFRHHQGVEYFLENRLNRLLQILIENRDSIVRRDEIIAYVWNEVCVNEENLTKGMFDLRKVLKKEGLDEIEIITIRNIGYKLVINTKETKKQLAMRLAMKSMMYVLIAISFLVILIRAFRYEN